MIFREGDPGDHGYVILSGRVSICKLINGEYSELVELTEGALFGEMAVIDHRPRSAAARAKTDTVVREVNEKALLDHIFRTPDTARDMMHRLVSYVRNANQALESSTLEAKRHTTATQSTAPTPHEHDGRRHLQRMEQLARHRRDNQQIIEAFQDPSTVLIEQRLPLPVKWGITLSLLLFLTLLLWSMVSVIDITLSLPGRLTTTTPTIPIQASEASTVAAIYIKPGQEVRQGELLATLDPTINDADYNRIDQQLHLLEDEILRLQLERSANPLNGIEQLQSATQRALLQSRWQAHQTELTGFDIESEQLQLAVESARHALTLAQLDHEEAQFQYQRQQRLVNEAILHREALTEAEFARKRATQRIRDSEHAITVAKVAVEALAQQRHRYLDERLSTLDQALVEAIEERNGVREERIKLHHRRQQLQIKAPVAGIVLELPKLFPGAIVTSGETLATLVPIDVPLMVEMDVDPQRITQIMVGNPVSVKLTALPYQEHGDLAATISYISEDTVHTSVNGEQGTFFRARAEIVTNRLRRLPSNFRLLPGIQVQSDIKSGQRHLITYLLYPVIRTLETSFTEP